MTESGAPARLGAGGEQETGPAVETPVPPPTGGTRAGVTAGLSQQSRRRIVWLCAVLAALPAVVAGITAIGVDWVPGSDYGPLEVRVRDVFSTHPPLVGPFSRLGGTGANHPGPAAFYALALPYRLLGSHPWALLVGAAAVNAMAMALAVRIAGRGGRIAPAALIAALSLACLPSLSPDHLRDPWNPHLALFPFLLACVASWAVLCGSRRSLPIAVAAAVFCAQCHAGYLLLVAVLALSWVVGIAIDREHWRRWARPVLLAVLVAALMWAPPLIEQVGDGSNLRQVLTGAGDSDEPRLGWDGVRSFVLPHLGPSPAWFSETAADPFATGGRSGLTLPPLGALVGLAALAVAVRRRRRDEVALVALTAGLWVAGTISVALITGLPVRYLYLWIRVLGILLWASGLLVLGRAAVDLLTDRVPSLRDDRGRPAWARPVALACGGLLAGGALLVARDTGRPAFAVYRRQFAGAAPLAAGTGEAVEAHPGPSDVVDVRWSGPLAFVVPAVVADIERRGHHVRVDPGGDNVWGRGRSPTAERPDLLVVISSEASARPPGGTLVATGADLPPDGGRGYAWLVDP